MLIDQDKELKQAILNLPDQEKTKLLFKLINKDTVLMEQLRHKLVDGVDSLNEKRDEVIKKIDKNFDHLKRMIDRYPNYLTPGELLMRLRDISGLVNDHVLITKDKIADVELRLYILNIGCNFGCDFLYEPTKRNRTLVDYIAGRMKYILPKYNRLYEDYQYDLKEGMNKMLTLVHSSAVSKLANELGFPKQV